MQSRRDHASLATAYSEVPANAPVITYSGNGQSAAHTWFILRYALGLENVSLYDGSWYEWGNMVRMPIDRT